MIPNKRNKPPLLKTSWAGAVLAGGNSQRFGSNKLLLSLPNGKFVCQQVGDALRPHCQALFCLSSVLAPSGFDKFVRLDDWQTQKGPMAGVMSALHVMETDWLMVIGGDMPWVTEDLVAWFQRQAESDNSRPWCGLGSHGLEPLFSAWPKSLVPEVSQFWEEGFRSPQSILKTLKVQARPPPPELGGGKIADPFRSINRPEDWESLLLEWKPSSHPPQSAN